MCAALQRLTHCLSQLFLLKDPTLSPRKNTSPEEWPTWTRAVLRGDKSLRPTTDYPFPSFFPSAPLGVGLLLGQRFPAPGTTETGRAPLPGPFPQDLSLSPTLATLGILCFPAAVEAAMTAAEALERTLDRKNLP